MNSNIQRYIEEIETLSEEYNRYSRNINKYLGKCVQLSLDIFTKVAEISNLPLRQVRLEAAYESVKELAGVLEETTISVPEFGNLEISNTYGTVVFVDITRSTTYFKDRNSFESYIERENYTGFVIFNSYITLIKSITHFFNGEFLEHTGDGAMLFFEEDVTSNYNNYYNNPIGLYFLAGEILKKYAKEKGLIDYASETLESNLLYKKIREPSLIHIGVSYGKVLNVSLGGMKKLISYTVWKAANNCKKAEREVEYKNYFHYSLSPTYTKLPIKIS